MAERIGDAPIDPHLSAVMNVLAKTIDEFLNGNERGRIIEKRQCGFVLLVFPFEDHEGRCNYISNAIRSDVVTLLKEQLARFSGQPEMKGRA